MEYIFTVTVSKGFDGGPVWSQYRSDNASCLVSTSVQDTPLVSITPKVRAPKVVLLDQLPLFVSLNILIYAVEREGHATRRML